MFSMFVGFALDQALTNLGSVPSTESWPGLESGSPIAP
jgi:hypothetical protein